MREYLPSGICMFVLEILLLLFYCKVIAGNTWVYAPIEIWITGCDVADFFLPLIASLPFSFLLFYKRKNNFMQYAGIRISLKKYTNQHILSAMIIAGVGTFFAYFLSLIIATQWMYQDSLRVDPYIYDYIWGNYQAEYPLMFGFIWCLWKGFVTSLFTLFGQKIALYVENLFIVSLTPFLYCMAENLVTALLGKPAYSIFTSFILNRLNPDVMHWWNYGIGVISYLVATNIIIILIKNFQGMRYDEQIITTGSIAARIK